MAIVFNEINYPATSLEKRIVLIGYGFNPQWQSHLNTVTHSISMNIADAGSSIIGFYSWSGCIRTSRSQGK